LDDESWDAIANYEEAELIGDESDSSSEVSSEEQDSDSSTSMDF